MEPRGLAFSTQPLKDALQEYDRTKPERDALWDTAETDADVDQAIAADQAALERVQEAFYAVTKDRNSLENCKRVDLPFMRELAHKYP